MRTFFGPDPSDFLLFGHQFVNRSLEQLRLDILQLSLALLKVGLGRLLQVLGQAQRYGSLV